MLDYPCRQPNPALEARVPFRTAQRWVARYQQFGLAVALLSVVAVASVVRAPMLANRLNNRTANTPNPEFSVTRLDGAVVKSSALKGHLIVLDFWATWCPPRRQKFPELEKLNRRY